MNAKNNVISILIAVIVCVIWIYICPAILTYYGDVWDSDGVMRQLPDELVALAKTSPDRVQAVGFVDDRSLHIFFITYMSLFVLLLTFQSSVKWNNLKSYLVWTAVLYLVYQWPHYLRATVDLGDARRIYSCYHADVHFFSFLLQDLRLLGMVGMFAIALHSAIQGTQKKASIGGNSVEQLLESSSHASRELTLWYIRSTLLALAFVPFTYFYWRNIMVRGAVAFAPSAVMIHIIWLVIWYSLTARLLEDWALWKESRKTHLKTIAEESAEAIEAKLQFLDRTKPSTDLRIFGSIVLAAVAFVAPILAPLFNAN